MAKIGKPVKNLAGCRFGKLIAIEINYTVERKYESVYWDCICDCGKYKTVPSGHLVSGSVQSCGCMRTKPKGESSFNRLLKNYKNNAKSRGLSFTLTKEEFYELTKQNCFYCDREPFQIIDDGHSNGEYIYNGLDRIDSAEGYTKNNVVPCCRDCNRAKWAVPQTEFLLWVDRVFDHIHNQNVTQ
jgi:hypothetical protein